MINEQNAIFELLQWIHKFLPLVQVLFHREVPVYLRKSAAAADKLV